jgi:hypothetical protein
VILGVDIIIKTRYTLNMMRKQGEMNMIEVGTEVIGNWGAMHPISEGVVVAVTESGYTIEWEEEDEYSGAETITCSYPFGDIKREGETSINGSPIGVFVKEDVEVTNDDIKMDPSSKPAYIIKTK